MFFQSFVQFVAGSTKEQQEATAKALEWSVEEVLREAGQADPTPEKRFEAWLLKQMKFENIRLPEDRVRVHDLLVDFQKLFNKKQLPDEVRDINRVKTITDLEKVIDGIKGTPIIPETSEDLAEILALPGTLVSSMSSDWVIIEVRDAQTASKLASGTKWCTSAAGTAESYIEHYGFLHVVYARHGQSLTKMFQFTGDYSQFMDLQDVPARGLPSSLLSILPYPKEFRSTGALRWLEMTGQHAPWEDEAFKKDIKVRGGVRVHTLKSLGVSESLKKMALEYSNFETVQSILLSQQLTSRWKGFEDSRWVNDERIDVATLMVYWKGTFEQKPWEALTNRIRQRIKERPYDFSLSDVYKDYYSVQPELQQEEVERAHEVLVTHGVRISVNMMDYLLCVFARYGKERDSEAEKVLREWGRSPFNSTFARGFEIYYHRFLVGRWEEMEPTILSHENSKMLAAAWYFGLTKLPSLDIVEKSIIQDQAIFREERSRSLSQYLNLLQEPRTDFVWYAVKKVVKEEYYASVGLQNALGQWQKKFGLPSNGDRLVEMTQQAAEERLGGV